MPKMTQKHVRAAVVALSAEAATIQTLAEHWKDIDHGRYIRMTARAEGLQDSVNSLLEAIEKDKESS